MKNQDLQLVNFAQAQRLKKAGFEWPTTPYYTFSGLLVDNLPRKEKMANGKYPTFFCPTVALALKWMRDVKDLQYAPFYYEDYRSWWLPNGMGKVYDTCEDAESELLDELLTLIEK